MFDFNGPRAGRCGLDSPPARSAVLNCPGCGSKVAADAAICPKCDYIIDSTFLGADLPPDANDDDEVSNPGPSASTNVGSAPKAPPARPARAAAAPARPAARTASSAGNRAAPARPARSAAAKPAPRRKPEPEPEPEEPEEEDWRTQRPDPEEEDWRPKRPAPAPAQPARAKDPDAVSFTAPDEAFNEARAFVDSLTLFDKVALGGVGLLFASLFLPWRETAATGDELGIVTSGFFAALVGLGGAGVLIARLRNLVPPQLALPPNVLVMAQVGLMGFSALLCLVFLFSNYDGTQVPAGVGNSTMAASSPSLGALVGLAGAVTGVLGSVLGMLGRRE